MSGEPQSCPRRLHGFGPWERAENLDRWEHRNQLAGGIIARHCSFCGSLHPDEFMRLLEEGAELGPTDKSYKAYIREQGTGVCLECEGSGKDETVIDHPCALCAGSGKRANGPQTKFYYQHLSDEQQARFIELNNERKLQIGYPGWLYVLPFFARRGAA